MTLVELFYMNVEQRQKTLVASQYAEQVLILFQSQFEQD